jgi:hypothetical protein
MAKSRAAAGGGTATPIEQGMVSRLVNGVRWALSGVSVNDWFGPMQPLAPAAQDQAQGRQFDYPVGFNTRTQPRGEEAVSYSQLRALADNCDLVRLAIETRKDQMSRLTWKIKPLDEEKDAQDDPRCKELSEKLLFPDGEHDWDTWMRMLLEEMLVVDAATIYPRKTRGGDMFAIELMDGSTIKRVINADGRTPMPPDPAYQQILKGIPAVDYTRDELLYVPRNPRVWKFYGFSPVEQVITHINISIRRSLSQLDYYTEGNIPDAIYSVPKEWTPEQIKLFQTYWDSIMEGSQAEKRRAKFVPEGVTLSQTRDPKLKDEYDEWLARVICFAFSLAPTALVKAMNRASSQQQQDSADEEGLAPTMNWLRMVMNQVLQRFMGYTDLQFAWEEEEAQDPLVMAQINKIYVDAKVLLPDEVRTDLGREPLTEEQKAELNPAPAVDADGNPVPPGKPGAKGATPPKPGQPSKPGEKEEGPDATGKLAKKKVSSTSRPSTAIAKQLRAHAHNSRRY